MALRSRKRVFADFRRAPDGSAFQKWEKFAKTCEDENIVDIDKRACIVWKSMSFRERFPYVNQSETLDASYTKALLQESSGLEQEDDEADSKNAFKRPRLYDHECCAACTAKNDNIFLTYILPFLGEAYFDSKGGLQIRIQLKSCKFCWVCRNGWDLGGYDEKMKTMTEPLKAGHIAIVYIEYMPLGSFMNYDA